MYFYLHLFSCLHFSFQTVTSYDRQCLFRATRLVALDEKQCVVSLRDKFHEKCCATKRLKKKKSCIVAKSRDNLCLAVAPNPSENLLSSKAQHIISIWLSFTTVYYKYVILIGGIAFESVWLNRQCLFAVRQQWRAPCL